MGKKATPAYTLMLFTKERCGPCAAAKPHVEKAVAELGVALEQVDAMSSEAGPLIMGFNILTVPTLIAVKDKKKWLEFSGAKELTAQHIVEKITKQLAKESS